MADAPEPPPPVTEAKPQPRRSGFLPLVAGGLIAAGLGYGAAQLWPLLPADGTAGPDEVSALKSEVARLSEALDQTSALQVRIDRLEAATPPDLAPLAARIDGLEQALSQLKTTPAALDPDALAGLQVQIDALKQGGIPEAALADVEAAFDARLAEAEARLDAVKAAADAIALAASQRAAVMQLRAALDSGAPYEAALSALPGVEVPAVLAEHGLTGLPSLQALRDSFPDAARAALDAALRANMGESWADRVSNFLLTQTGARSLTPREGGDPDAILSRAEAALAQGNLAATSAEITTLPPEAQAAMQAWTAAAQLRQEAIQAVQSLSSALGI